MKKKKKFEREAPDQVWFWKNRHKVWAMHPDMEIEKPQCLINKEKEEQDEHI